MTAKELPSPDLLRKLLRYDDKTGKLYWRERPKSSRLWNEKYAGREAIKATDSRGYHKGKIFGKNVLAHRVIWAMVNNKWPQIQIDHINGNPSDNRLQNLREATALQNSYNGKLCATNTSGSKGVIWNKAIQKWTAQIRFNGTKRHLGVFEARNDAYEAYCAAAKTYHKEFANTGGKTDED